MHETAHGCGCTHDNDSHEHEHHRHEHHEHEHLGHEHPSVTLQKNHTLITLNAYEQDSASVVSLEWTTCQDARQTELLLKQLFKKIARDITEQNGIIGHIKASMEMNEVVMISLTDTDAMKKMAQSPTIFIHAVVIALCIEKDTLTHLVESALDNSPLFSI